MSDVVVGVDPSSKKMAAVVTVGDSEPEVFTLTLRHDKAEATADTYNWIQMLVNRPGGLANDVFVFVELPVMGRAGIHTTIVIAQQVGAVMAAAINAGAHVTTVNVQHWKKVVVGKGNCGKPEVKKWAKDNWPYLYDLADGNQDLIDAAAICRYGMHTLGLRKKIASTKRRRVVRRKPSGR